MKSPAAVLCAHCRQNTARPTCPVCKRTVCPACAADWTTCSQPSSRTFRLGRGRRLRAVSPDGRYGIVARMLGATRLVDLRALRWVDVPGVDLDVDTYSRLPPVLVADARFVRPSFELYGTGSQQSALQYNGLEWRGLDNSLVGTIPGGRPQRLRVSASGRSLIVVTNEEVVDVVHLGATPELRSYKPLKRERLQAADYDEVPDRLLAGAWGAAYVFAIDGDELRTVRKLPLIADCEWAGLRGDHAAVITRKFGVYILHVHHAESGVLLGMHRYAARTTDHGSMSADGRFVAMAMADHRVAVYDVELINVTLIDDPTDDVCLVQFIGNDELIVADTDNRVFIYKIVNGVVIPTTVNVELSTEPVAFSAS